MSRQRRIRIATTKRHPHILEHFAESTFSIRALTDATLMTIVWDRVPDLVLLSPFEEWGLVERVAKMHEDMPITLFIPKESAHRSLPPSYNTLSSIAVYIEGHEVFSLATHTRKRVRLARKQHHLTILSHLYENAYTNEKGPNALASLLRTLRTYLGATASLVAYIRKGVASLCQAGTTMEHHEHQGECTIAGDMFRAHTKVSMRPLSAYTDFHLIHKTWHEHENGRVLALPYHGKHLHTIVFLLFTKRPATPLTKSLLAGVARLLGMTVGRCSNEMHTRTRNLFAKAAQLKERFTTNTDIMNAAPDAPTMDEETVECSWRIVAKKIDASAKEDELETNTSMPTRATGYDETKGTHEHDKEMTPDDLYRSYIKSKQRTRKARLVVRRLMRLFRAARMGVITLDSNFFITRFDTICKRIFGYSKKEAREMTWGDILVDKEKFFAMKREVKEKGSCKDEAWCMTKEGEEIWARYYVIERNDRPRSAGYIVMVYNMTDQKHIQQELLGIIKMLNKTRARLRKATEEREEAIAFKETFLAEITHDLRTPLNGIISFSKNIANGKYKDEAKKQERASSIYALSKKMNTLIDDLLTINKINEQKLVLHKHPFNLTDALQHEANTIFKPLFDFKGVEFSFIAASTITVNADEVRIRQAVDNLLSNALKFTRKGHVTLRLSSNNDVVMIEVSDTGIGIKEHELSAIFERFRQGNDNQPTGGGVGLGLSIVQSLVTLHGGTISVSSEWQHGTTFTITLPHVDEEPFGTERTDETATTPIRTSQGGL